MKPFLRDLNDVEHFLEEAQNEELESEIDEYYDSLGYSGLDAEFLSESLNSLGLEGSEVTFIIPRQINTDTVEQIGMVSIANQAGDFMVDEGHVDSYNLEGIGITDKMVSGQNFLKRGYALPAVINESSIRQGEVTQIKDGSILGTHSIDDSRPVMKENLESEEADTSSLRDYYRSLATITGETGLIDEVHTDIIKQMVREGSPPEVLGYKAQDGRITPMRYDSSSGSYESVIPDIEISCEAEEIAERGLLSPEDNYEKFVFPVALHPEYFHMLNGLHNSKFQTENTRSLRDEVERDIGYFPFIDFSTSESEFHDSVPDQKIERLKETEYGKIHYKDDPTVDGMILNTYPSTEIKSDLDKEAKGLRANSFEQKMRNIVQEVYTHG